MVMPLILVVYIFVYNKRKRAHQQEKLQMEAQFELELTKTQQEIREQTMQTIGADLHDNIGQLLSLTTLTLKSIPQQDPEKTSQRIGSSIELLAKAISEMRQLGKLIQGEQLLELGLSKAIGQEVDWLSRSESYQIEFTSTGSNEKRNPDIDLFYFRILQEILNNIIKHADATSIQITLSYLAQEIQLKVSDNGIGFKQNPAEPSGSGLANIKKRASIIGGAVTINSTPNKGTTITISTPYP